MKRNNPQSDTAVRDFPSFKNLESLTAAATALPAAQWQQYAEAASRFAAEWADEMDEKGEAHSFWDEFLQIFHIRRRQFARHEARAKRSDNRRGFIDLFWPGKLLVEHKAGHKNKADDFDEALRQAMDYIGELEAKDRPKRLILCNFKTFQIYEVPNVLPNPSSAGKTTLRNWGSAVQFHGKTSEVFKTSEVWDTALNTQPKQRSPNLAPALQAFPYVNGGLFSVAMEQTPPGDAGFRMGLLECGKFDWASISPEIFGSLFQEVLTATERRSLGAHYTSEKNILRLIEPLFLDELREEFKAVRKNEKKLAAFRGKLHKLRFLEPACGCWNFVANPVAASMNPTEFKSPLLQVFHLPKQAVSL